jgi:antirestriction protein ArdC
MATKRDVYAEVTARIVAQLDEGIVPWKRPWNSSAFPMNAKSDRPYRGINVFLLAMAAEEKEYESPYWTTFSQIQELSGYVYDKELKRMRYRFTPGTMACPDLGKDKDGKTIRGEAFEILGRNTRDGKIHRLVSGSTDLASPDCKVWNEGEFTHPKYGVKKGEKGTSIIFWKPLESHAKDDDGNLVFDNGEPVMRRSFLLRIYSVFNIEQCKLPDTLELFVDPMDPIDHDQVADDVVTAYLGDLNGPSVKHGTGRASYSPPKDQVSMPSMDAFHTTGGYYSTFFHELVHSTGHEERLFRIKEPDVFGSDQYAREELVAEMGASMMLGLCGMVSDDQEQQTAAYIHGWMKAIKDDPTILITAAAQAQRACDHVQGVTFGEED